ncbi:hypothetical protein TrVE_jg5982 [Triparma verrucosa]|uniref:EF-hand domain-containing protein n=1 Tax=Triparma verrucosa TaxID=1606542 RepID=A0A9W7BH98_9STRA|nr:hypothetical protein TrVE_jg5982 [Triparma verrucosa]
MSTSASSSSFLTDAILRADGEIEGPPPASDFLDSFHFVSHMLHRATEVSGAIPSETVEDRTAKHEQIEVLAKNKEMNTVIENMRILSKQFEDIVHSVSSHRKELGRSIRQTHTTYVRLFERMLFVVLKLQRKRDKKNEREVQGYRDQISQLVLQNDLLQAQLLKLGDQNSALVGLNQSLHVDNDRLIEENAKLDKYFKLYHDISQEMKKNAIKMVVEKEELKKQLAAEEEAMTERFRLAEEQWAEERKKMFEELKASKRKPTIITKPAIPVGTVPKKKRVFKKKIIEIKPVVEKGPVERSDGFCQTEVNDDGLWQKQDGWIINVDEDVLARALWRRALRFVGCPCCKGAGEFLQNVVQEFKNPHKKLQIEEEVDSDEDDDASAAEDISKKKPKRRGRRSGLDSCWMLPDELVEFLSNLPKTVQGARPKPLAWLCKEINGIFDEKFEADRQDGQEGQQTQAMNDFLMELFLKRYGLRRLAELNLYVLIITIKEYYEMNSLVHTMARFMNLIDEPSKKDKGRGGEGGGKDGEGDIVPSNKQLDTSFLTAFLWTREKLLSDYHGVYMYGANERRNGGRGSMEGLPTHCIVQRGCDFFVPLDRIVYMVKLVLNFLTPRKLATYSRQIEKRCQVLTKDGKVEKGEGARMIIRSKMRDSMLKVTPGKTIHQHKAEDLDAGETGSDDEDAEVEDKDDVQIVVDMYQTLQMMMEILNLRVHHMEDQLKRYFIEGDDNGDGVLSFDEFDALLKRIAPSFSDRRILRMFREALCSGPDSSFAIEKSTFAAVCKNHGLVNLIDSKELEEIHAEEQVKAKHHKERLERLKEERAQGMKKMERVEEEEES